MKFTISKNITWCHVVEYYSYFKSMNKPTFTPAITTTPKNLFLRTTRGLYVVITQECVYLVSKCDR